MNSVEAPYLKKSVIGYFDISLDIHQACQFHVSWYGWLIIFLATLLLVCFATELLVWHGSRMNIEQLPGYLALSDWHNFHWSPGSFYLLFTTRLAKDNEASSKNNSKCLSKVILSQSILLNSSLLLHQQNCSVEKGLAVQCTFALLLMRKTKRVFLQAFA